MKEQKYKSIRSIGGLFIVLLFGSLIGCQPSEQSGASLTSSTQIITNTPSTTNTPSPTSTPTPTIDPDIYKNWSGFYAADTTIEQQTNGDWYFTDDYADLINLNNEGEYIQDFCSVVKDEQIEIIKNYNSTYSVIRGYTWDYSSFDRRCNIYLIKNGQLRRLNLSKLFDSDVNVDVEISDYGNAMIVEASSGLFWYDLIRDEVYQLAQGDRSYEYAMSENGKSVLYTCSNGDYSEQMWIFNGGVNELFGEMDTILSSYTPLAISDDARSIWYFDDGSWSCKLYLNNSMLYSGIGVQYHFNSNASECFFADYYASEDGGNIYGFVKSGDYEPSLLSLNADSRIITNYYWLHDYVGRQTELFSNVSGETFNYSTDSLRYWPMLYVDEYNCVYQINLDNMPYPKFLFEIDGKFADSLSYMDSKLFLVQDNMPCYADVSESSILVHKMMPDTQEPLFNYYIDKIINSYDMEHNIYRSTDNRYYIINEEKNGFTEIDSLKPEKAGYLSKSNVILDVYDYESGEYYDVSVLREKGIDLYMNLDAYCEFYKDSFNFNALLGLSSEYMEICHSYNSFCAFVDMNSWAEDELHEYTLTESGFTLYEKYPEACGNYVPLTDEMAEDLRYITQKFSSDTQKWLEFLVLKPNR